jgi:hypothetical protein
MIRKIFSSAIALSMLFGVGASAFAEEIATGSLVVNQVGAVGTIAVAGPSTASVISASSTIAAAAVGSYTITVTAPTGFVLDSVKDGTNVVLVSPYAQVLVAGATITYNVNFVAAPVTLPPVPAEITKQMIKDKTAACATMEAGDAKKACMKERNVMKKAFQKQEKAKRELAREEAKLKKEEARKAKMEAMKAKMEAKAKAKAEAKANEKGGKDKGGKDKGGKDKGGKGEGKGGGKGGGGGGKGGDGGGK